MSTFSNPAGGAASAGQAYTRAMLDVIGDRDPLAVMDELVSWLTARLRGLDDARLRQPEQPGKWSAMEVVHHLADTELVYGYRIRTILTEDNPPIRGYDQDAWARDLGYRTAPLAAVMAQLATLRAANLRLYRSLSPAQLARAGVHSERGPESIAHTIRLLGAHDLVHRRQIDRILAGV
jgi:DinB superfamily